MERDPGEKNWLSFRLRARIVSTALVAASTSGLLLAYYYGPKNSPKKPSSWHLSEHQFGLVQTILSTLLSIGVVSLLFEFLLRKDWATDLLHFLNLRVAVAQSGLEHIGNEGTVDWAEVLPGAVRVEALIRDPGKWYATNLQHLLTASQRRPATIVIGLPDPDGPNFGQVAASVGLTDIQLRGSIDLAGQLLEGQWATNEPNISVGSVFRIVMYTEIPMYEVVSVDNTTYCLLSKPVGHVIGDYALVVKFFQDGPQYPTTWLRKCLEPFHDRNEWLVRKRDS